jgi:hypothetical protein
VNAGLIAPVPEIDLQAVQRATSNAGKVRFAQQWKSIMHAWFLSSR